MPYPRKRRLTTAIVTTAAGSLLLSSCAGSASGDGGSGEGFEYGASQETVDALLTDLDDVEITYQTESTSPNSPNAVVVEKVTEYIEDRSNGKISVDLVWGQGIAGFSDIDNALQDGRIDLAYAIPVYEPSEYPAFNALATANAGMPSSPVVGEMVTSAALLDMAWNSEALLTQYADKGITPITPVTSHGAYYSLCGDDGTSLDDWKGRQVRVASLAHEQLVQAIGGSPTSMEYVEVFEALQRGTVDCTWVQLEPALETGLLEAGSHLSHPSSDASLPGRTAGATLVGTGYEKLPLAYQQIIFDAGMIELTERHKLIPQATSEALEQFASSGGEVGQMEDETNEQIRETNRQMLADLSESETIGPDVAKRAESAAEKWNQVAEEVEVGEEAGSLTEMGDWYTQDDFNFEAFTARVYEEVAVPHRPN